MAHLPQTVPPQAKVETLEVKREWKGLFRLLKGSKTSLILFYFSFFQLLKLYKVYYNVQAKDNR